MVKVNGNVCGKEGTFDFDGAMMLTNEFGGFYIYSERDFSKYQGLFFNEGMDVFKSVDSITLENSTGVELIEKNFAEIIFQYCR